jgi:hypothetical protein
MIDPQNDTVTSHNGPMQDRERATGAFDELLPQTMRQTFAEQEDRMRELIRSHPLAAVFGALALGYVVAKLARGISS